MTKKGKKAFEDYVEALKDYLDISAKTKKGK
jgi:hypothetical protein